MLQKQLTYNGIRNRIKNVCANHRFVKTVFFNRFTELVADKNINYPAVFIEAKGGTIAPDKHATTVSFRMFILDRTFLSEDSTENESDVVSDCIGIATDLTAQLGYVGQLDGSWNFTSSSYEILIEKDSDVTAGIYFDFIITVAFFQNVCATASDLPINIEDMKETYDEYWQAPSDILDGTFSFPVPDTVKGKKIILVVRANYPLYRTTAISVQSNEYAFDGNIITYGTPIEPDERTLMLYRQY